MTELLTIAEASRRIAAKQLSPVELTSWHLARIRALDPRIHAFLLVTEERALADARAAEARQMSGGLKGPLDGVPIAHKDIFNTAGIRTTAHSRLLEHNVPTEDAAAVRRLADAGTVLMGKLATHEFAIGGHSFDLAWPQPGNPWNPEHTTAGSSSGTAAAVAAGLILGGTGSDTAGSIRGPSALCGITGLKPTYGLVSRVGLLPASFTLDHAGPMAWTAEDCAILLQAMAGYEPDDAASVNRPVPDFRGDLNKGAAGLRIGVVRHFHETDNPASAATLKGINEAVALFESQGATVREVRLSSLAEYNTCAFLIILADMYAVHEPWLRSSWELYGRIFRNRVAIGGLILGADYVQALRRRRELCLELQSAMTDLDLLMTAAQAGEAPRIVDTSTWGFLELPALTTPANLTGYPAISVCTGFGAGSLPVAMQLIGKPFQEPTVFRAAHAYETATEWRQRRPELAA
ncbi:MAG TPA: amidase [Acetobacteraceae bacterium]|nr:amidase [Acetobacteraceae bacterium]